MLSTTAPDSPGWRANLLQFDIRGTTFSVLRAGIALSQILTLVATPYAALMQSVMDREEAPYCGGIKAISAFCVGGDGVPPTLRVAIIVALLAAVALGVLPGPMAVAHAWISFSLVNSIALPDGGETIASIATLILIPIAFSDNRRWVFDRNPKPLPDFRRGIGYAGVIALRIQVAIIYLNSAVAKTGVEDWANGSAEYYFVRSYMFGASGWVKSLLEAVTDVPVLVAALTWGVIIGEVTIGLCVLLGPRWRKIAFIAAAVLHLGIIATIGLWSFATVMICVVGIACMPTAGRKRLLEMIPRRIRSGSDEPAETAARSIDQQPAPALS